MLDILFTAVLSAGLTLAGAYVAGRRILAQQIAPLVQAEVDKRVAELGDVIETRVRNGVVSAVTDVTSPESLQKRMVKGQDSLLNALFGKGIG